MLLLTQKAEYDRTHKHTAAGLGNSPMSAPLPTEHATGANSGSMDAVPARPGNHHSVAVHQKSQWLNIVAHALKEAACYYMYVKAALQWQFCHGSPSRTQPSTARINRPAEPPSLTPAWRAMLSPLPVSPPFCTCPRLLPSPPAALAQERAEQRLLRPAWPSSPPGSARSSWR